MLKIAKPFDYMIRGDLVLIIESLINKKDLEEVNLNQCAQTTIMEKFFCRLWTMNYY
jgi:hypothetical protein